MYLYIVMFWYHDCVIEKQKKKKNTASSIQQPENPGTVQVSCSKFSTDKIAVWPEGLGTDLIGSKVGVH